MRDHDLLDVSKALQTARRAHQQLLAVALDIACAAVAVVARQGIGHVRHRQAPRQQLLRIRQHVVLLVEATNAVDLRHARRKHELWADNPVLHLAQTHGIPGAAIRLHGARLSAHGVHVDLTQPGADRPHLRLQTGWQLTANRRQPLVDEVAGKVQIGAFFKHHSDLRQRIARQRAGIGQLWQAG